MAQHGCRVRKAVENVLFVRVLGGYARMVEGEFGAVGHAELFHHSTGRRIDRNGDSNEFCQIELVEGEIHDGACCFGGESFALAILRKSPANLDSGLRQIGNGITHDLYAYNAGEGAVFAEFGREHGEAIAFELLEVTMDVLIALDASPGRGEETHDTGVCVHRREGLAITLLPEAKEEA